MNKPLIGVSTNSTSVAISMSSKQRVTIVADAYTNIISDYGGIPILIPNEIEVKDVSKIVSIISGLLLIGGQDIAASSYNEETKVKYDISTLGLGENFKRPQMLAPNIKRDQIEIALCQQTAKAGKPILGLCRGMQIINIANGGTLYQELPESKIAHFLDEDGWFNYHDIIIDKNSWFYDRIKENKYSSSTLHHQCIDKLGKDLRASARAEDNIIEIIENIDMSKFVVGIQGHPEKTRRNQFKYEFIFEEFIRRTSVDN